MKKDFSITTLFLDIGGVLLTNGWDHNARKLAAGVFDLDFAELEERHHLTYDTYEEGKLTIEEYLNRLVFYRERSFTADQFREFIYKQSKPYPDMIQLIRQLKEKYGLKVAVISNEGRELTVYRIKKFKLNEFVDFFISSCFVHFRKPDANIFRMALDVSQVSPDHVLYIEDRAMFLQAAEDLGIRGVRHVDFCSTVSRLAFFGLTTTGPKEYKNQ
jgi:putative hydrolase of the HAD superfamily